jgi:outer membrane protein TolC
MRSVRLLTVALLLAIAPVAARLASAQYPSTAVLPSPQADTGSPPVFESQGTLLGGVPTGSPSSVPLQLSLDDAVKRGLQYNLGIILGEQSITSARGVRMRALSDLMPKLSANTTDSGQQINLAAFGISSPSFPSIVGPFNLFDVRLYFSQTILDFSLLNKKRMEDENIKAAEFSYRNTRDQVVLVCASLYLQAVAGSSRIEAVRAQLATAQALYNLAVDQKKAGIAAGIDVLRTNVELQEQQQRLIVAEAEFEKEKLSLARAIGLPLGQGLTLSEPISYAPLAPMAVDDAVNQAYANRADYQRAMALVRAAESERKSAAGERLPSLGVTANYGDLGESPASSHGTFAVAASLNIPIFQGGRVRAKLIEADAAIQRRKAELEDLRGRIYYEIRTAYLDLKATGDRVQVAKSSVDLAGEQVTQARDRFSAGVANTVEIVQAQEALARATDNYISSLYSYNIAKAALARALGIAEGSYLQFLRGK